MRSISSRSARERGAVAVMVAIMATMLFSVAALAVDLGNAWARKRAVQKQVDVSAIGAGWMLPMTSANKQAIADKVAEYLNDDENQAAGQADVSGDQLIDNSGSPDDDGELTFMNDDGTACVTNCTQMRVLAPVARVEFGLASVMGFSGTDVQRTATVQVLSELPPKKKTLPFWLPSGCGYGPTEADTDQGGNGGGGPSATPTATPTATATATATATTPSAPTPVDASIVLSGAAVTSVGHLGTTTINGYAVTGVQGYKKITLRAFPPNGSGYVDYGVELPKNGSAVPPFQVDTEISATAGDWVIYVYAEKNNDFAYSSTGLVVRVTGGPSSPSPSETASSTPTESAAPGGCVGQDRGNFGQLDSPRVGYNAQQGFPYNVALGIDHRLVPYVFPPSVPEDKDCGKNSPSLPGGKLDDVAGPAGDGANCIKGDTGNDGPKTYEGLVAGVDGSTPGRLDISNGSTTCPGRSNLTLDGKTINNDVLSCFLRNGASLGDLAQTSGVTQDMLDPSVVRSPRFVWMPVVYATDRAQKDFQPIRQFVPGFITDETQVSTFGSSDATGTNGLEIDGNSVKVLHVYTFNRAALPPNEQSDTTEYDPEVGGAIVRLIK